MKGLELWELYDKVTWKVQIKNSFDTKPAVFMDNWHDTNHSLIRLKAAQSCVHRGGLKYSADET